MSIDSLGSFVGKLCQVIEGHPTEEQILQETKYLMADLVSTDDWLPDRYAMANPDYYQQYLLYCDGVQLHKLFVTRLRPACLFFRLE